MSTAMKPQRLKIHIVDDSDITQKKISQIIEKLGHKVIQTSSSGKNAIFDCSYVHADIITMDITMPDMDGVTATRRLLSSNPDLRIIMVTSVSQKDIVMDAIKAGAIGYVMKPIEPEKLALAFKQAMKKKPPKKSNAEIFKF